MILVKTLSTVGKISTRKCIKQPFCKFNVKFPCDQSNCCNFPTFFMVRKICCVNNNIMQQYDKLLNENTNKSPTHSKSYKHTKITSRMSREEKIIEEYKSYYYSKSKNNFNDALFVLGPMGSGKTTVIKSKIMSHEKYGKYAYVDTDELMAHLPGFNENKINIFYPIARRMAIELTDWLLEKQLSFVAEGTCVKYQELIDYMIRLKEKGYKINVCKINGLSLEMVLHRASNRIQRKVQPELVKEIYLKSHFGIDEIYRKNNKDKIFENINTDEF